jgi:uncharacterized lipoprotein YmbA
MRILPALCQAVVAFSVLAGCAATPPSRFYVLRPVANATVTPAQSAPAIGVGPVELPNYLDRPEIAVRIGTYELHYSQMQRWAETLRNNVTGVLAEDLARLVPTEQVARFPWGRTTRVDFQVAVEISQFDADENGTVVLSAIWKLYRGESRDIVTEKKSVFNETCQPNNYTEIVAAQSHALAALSQEIAAAIRKAAGH